MGPTSKTSEGHQGGDRKPEPREWFATFEPILPIFFFLSQIQRLYLRCIHYIKENSKFAGIMGTDYCHTLRPVTFISMSICDDVSVTMMQCLNVF